MSFPTQQPPATDNTSRKVTSCTQGKYIAVVSIEKVCASRVLLVEGISRILANLEHAALSDTSTQLTHYVEGSLTLP